MARICELNGDQLAVVEVVIEGVAQVTDPATLQALTIIVEEDIAITTQLDGGFLGVFSDALARLDRLL